MGRITNGWGGGEQLDGKEDALRILKRFGKTQNSVTQNEGEEREDWKVIAGGKGVSAPGFPGCSLCVCSVTWVTSFLSSH